jgi:putative acetyltransferase
VDVAALRQPNVLFAVARDGQRVAGCGAVLLHETWGELKRMYVSPEMRGRGLGRGLLEFLERQAIGRGCGILRLETGIHQPEAQWLYRRAGFVIRSPFGSYTEDPHSVYMEKEL